MAMRQNPNFFSQSDFDDFSEYNGIFIFANLHFDAIGGNQQFLVLSPPHPLFKHSVISFHHGIITSNVLIQRNTNTL